MEGQHEHSDDEEEFDGVHTPSKEWAPLVNALSTTPTPSSMSSVPPSFACGGRIPNNTNPAVSIHGFGLSPSVQLPVFPNVLEHILPLTEVVPQDSTGNKVAQNVRKIEVNRWRAENPEWQETLESLIKKIKAEMVIGDPFKVTTV